MNDKKKEDLEEFEDVSWMEKGLKPEVRKTNTNEAYYILIIILLTVLIWVIL